MRRTRALAVALALVPVPALHSQDADSTGAGGVPVLSPLWRTLSDSSRAAWVRPLASAVIPGAGQMLGRAERGALYLIAEALLVTRFIALRQEGQRERSRFQDLAFVIARGEFRPTRQDTSFQYFETMAKFVESGPFDTDPGSALSPPTDERSFNGSLWALATRTFFRDPDNPPDPDSPEYQRALTFYAGRAIGPNFSWSWRNAGIEQDEFRQTIRRSDEAFRGATQQLGLLLANHVLSAVDAFISHRLSRDDRSVEIETTLLRPAMWGGAPDVGVIVQIAF